jgi:hypothetical protein
MSEQMTKRKTIKLDNGNMADAVDELADALRAANAPIFIHRNRLVWRFPADGCVLPLNTARLRAELDQYVTFNRKGKTINAPGDLLGMFIDVAQTYRFFPDLPDEE